MKKIGILFLFVFVIFATVPVHAQDAQPLSVRLSGQILLQVESYGRAWYVHPVDQRRYYLQDGQTAYEIMRDLGLGISNADLAKIPIASSDFSDASLVNRVLGRIVLQVEEHGEAWYINPDDKLRYYMKDGDAAYEIMRSLSLGITNEDLATIKINDTQIVHDTTFDDVAYVKLTDGIMTASKFHNQILPPASMTKLLTALVLLDQNPDWSKAIRVTPDHIAYPRYYAGTEATSEVDIKAGDILSFNDLWIAMLVASSNQAVVALVDSSGLTRDEFNAELNKKALDLGLKKSRFYDSTGLDAHNVTTPYEMALIANEAFDQPEILRVYEADEHVIQTLQNPIREIKVIDRNHTLKPYEPDAVKTGYLIEAQRCVSLKKGNDIIVVMHARSMSERNNILNQLISI